MWMVGGDSFSPSPVERRTFLGQCQLSAPVHVESPRSHGTIALRLQHVVGHILFWKSTGSKCPERHRLHLNGQIPYKKRSLDSLNTAIATPMTSLRCPRTIIVRPSATPDSIPHHRRATKALHHPLLVAALTLEHQRRSMKAVSLSPSPNR